MSSANHTPGPWYVQYVGGYYKSSSFYIRGSKANGEPMTWGLGCVAHIPRSTVNPSEANAKLIAAAPELLEALKKIEGSSMSMYATYSDAFEHQQDIARAAIAKAFPVKPESL